MIGNKNDKRIINRAQEAGVELEYQDSFGQIQRASLETVRSVLKAKGVSLEKPGVRSDDSLLVQSIGSLPESFTVVLSHGDLVAPLDQNEDSLILVIEDEHSQLSSYRFKHGSYEIVEDGDLLKITAPFPRELDIGTYRVRISCVKGNNHYQRSYQWIICPDKAYIPPKLLKDKKRAGVNISLYGVRSGRNLGVGDFTDLMKIIDWASDSLKVDFIGVNPLHAIFNAFPYNTSPYNPSSRIYRNYIYLDIEAIPDFQEAPEARAWLKEAEDSGLAKSLRDSETVDYERVAELKLTILRLLFDNFIKNHFSQKTPYANEYTNYAAYQGQYLERFSTFCALRNHFVSLAEPIYNWRDWPDELHDSRSDAARRYAKENPEEIMFWGYLQWMIERQLARAQKYAKDRGMEIGLYHDMALGVDSYGADAWAEPDLYLQEFSVGAPPDPFAPDGQNWGFPAPNGDANRRSFYEPFARILQSGIEYGGALRIDHVMQLKRLFWIEKGKPASQGVYVTENETELMNIVGLSSVRNKAIIIGEDLGTTPGDFRQRMMDKNILSYRLFYFEETQDGRMLSSHEYPEKALVSINTHDLPTFAGFWSGRDIDLRKEIGQLNEKDESSFREDRKLKKAKIIEKLVQEGFLPAKVAHRAWESTLPTDELHGAVLSFIFKTPCALALINQEDILRDHRQQNLPAAPADYPNWVTKMKFTVEELTSHPEAIRFSEIFRNLLITADRASSLRNR